MSKIIIVDDQDNEIGLMERRTLSNQIYRVAALWVTNPNGQILLAQRSFKKKNSPGRWGPAVAGTVEEGETYESNILKEAREEIGLTGIKLQPLKKIGVRLEYGKNYFCQYFKAVVDKPASDFVIQEEEVESVEWFNKAFLLEDLRVNPEKYVVSIKQIIELEEDGQDNNR